jgi:hypothetical protein
MEAIIAELHCMVIYWHARGQTVAEVMPPCDTSKHYCNIVRTIRYVHNLISSALTLIQLTWRIWWAPNNASKWQMRFNSVFNTLPSGHAEIRDCYPVHCWQVTHICVLLMSDNREFKIWCYCLSFWILLHGTLFFCVHMAWLTVWKVAF